MLHRRAESCCACEPPIRSKSALLRFEKVACFEAEPGVLRRSHNRALYCRASERAIMHQNGKRREDDPNIANRCPTVEILQIRL